MRVPWDEVNSRALMGTQETEDSFCEVCSSRGKNHQETSRTPPDSHHHQKSARTPPEMVNVGCIQKGGSLDELENLKSITFECG